MTDSAPIDDSAALTRHIEARYHRRHREQLPDLAALSARVETVHAGDPSAPAGLATLLEKLIGELEVHMKKEELILFPAIRRGSAAVREPIAAMRADHDDHTAGIAEIRRLTAALTLPKGACRTWTALYEGLGSFVADLEEHIRLENDVLFPRFEGVA
ncbi:hemerythrin domain-containing protein [Amaricoccus sp.]|uniref:hemerythrin domain-containing protein n=1 Tax=Amaricoccus sp. TaxID=1872485 RepID=UPI002632C12C|nr:hemerythrin domain-containing protein [Amaricoccus sp.]HRO10944.1 hemerythrin domain-containing protein [Amaricoccus sp.]